MRPDAALCKRWSADNSFGIRSKTLSRLRSGRSHESCFCERNGALACTAARAQFTHHSLLVLCTWVGYVGVLLFSVLLEGWDLPADLSLSTCSCLRAAAVSRALIVECRELDHNSLQGPIPTEVGRLTSLGVL